MSATVAWLRRYGWLVVVALGGIVGALLSRKRPPPLAPAKRELAGIKAEAAVEQHMAIEGKDAAVAAVQATYEAQRATLDAKQHAEAAQLGDDPVRLAGWLARIGDG